MARLSKEQVQIRENEATEAFKNGAKVKDVNEALFTKHGKRMGLARLYELREAVRAAQVTQSVVDTDDQVVLTDQVS
jgi:ribosomal protein S16